MSPPVPAVVTTPPAIPSAVRLSPSLMSPLSLSRGQMRKMSVLVPLEERRAITKNSSDPLLADPGVAEAMEPSPSPATHPARDRFSSLLSGGSDEPPQGATKTTPPQAPSPAPHFSVAHSTLMRRYGVSEEEGWEI